MSSGPRILIVDDEPQMRSFLSLTFKRAGYDVSTAGNGREAVALFSAEPFDLVLSDVMMPEMNGHQLTQWVSVHYPETRTALMSAYDAICREYPDVEPCEQIAKPFLPMEIVSFVAHVLAA